MRSFNASDSAGWRVVVVLTDGARSTHAVDGACQVIESRRVALNQGAQHPVHLAVRMQEGIRQRLLSVLFNSAGE